MVQAITDDKLEQDLLNKGNVCDLHDEMAFYPETNPINLDSYKHTAPEVVSLEKMLTLTKTRIFELLSNKLTNMFMEEEHLIKPAYDNTKDKHFDLMIRDLTERVRAYADMKHQNDLKTINNDNNDNNDNNGNNDNTVDVNIKKSTDVASIYSIGNYILEFESSNVHLKDFAELLVNVINQHDLNDKLTDTFITVTLVTTQKYLNIMKEVGWNNVISYGILVPGKDDKEITWSQDYGRYRLPIKVSIMIKSTPVYLRTFYIYALANA